MKSIQTHYSQYLDHRIERCLEKAMLMRTTRSGCSRYRAELAVQEAMFYRIYRERLLEEMAFRGIPTSQDAVDRFLMESYSDLPIDGRTVLPEVPASSSERIGNVH